MAAIDEAPEASFLRFQGGPVPKPTPTIPELRESASDWLRQASEHFAEGEVNAELGSLDVAIEQLQFAETKTAVARMRLCEARALLRRNGQ